MISKTKSKLFLIGTQAAVATTFLSGGIVKADCSDSASGIDAGASCARGTGQSGSLLSNIQTVTNVLLLFVGITAVIMLIVGGFQYIFSSGDSSKTKTAKDTILYAIVGIIVALLAYAIVNFVLTRFSSSS